MAENKDRHIQTSVEPEHVDDYVWNEPVGSHGGSEYIRVSRERQLYISRLILYTHKNYPHMMQAIKVEWSNGTDETIGNPESSGADKLFLEGEKFTYMAIRSEGSLHGVYLATNRATEGWSGGGTGGKFRQQNLGNGFLAGFHGRFDGDTIFTIGAVFWKDKEGN